jgi:apolipoprotein N-acyltransferase
MGEVSVGICFDIAWPLESGSHLGLILSNEDWLGAAFSWWQNQVQRVRTIEISSEIIRVTNRGAVYAFP